MNNKYYIRYKNITFCCRDCGTRISTMTALYRPGRCHSCANKTRILSKETRLKISKSNKGRVGFWLGKKLSKESIEKRTKSREGKCEGKNHPGWNFNKSMDERIRGRWVENYSSWINKILKRDNFTCQSCGVKVQRNSPHHLEGWHWCKELRTEVSNGVTLCKDCHKTFHKQFGTHWNTSEQFYKFLRSFK